MKAWQHKGIAKRKWIKRNKHRFGVPFTDPFLGRIVLTGYGRFRRL